MIRTHNKLAIFSGWENLMFTYKFTGLDKSDAETPYYYGSLPAKPELGRILAYDGTGNRYAIVRIDGAGLVDDGDGSDNQKVLAWADIGRGETVPTLWLLKAGGSPFVVQLISLLHTAEPKGPQAGGPPFVVR